MDNTVKNLNKLLADIYVIYFKTHSFHWNIVGLDFRAMHLMLEEHYLKFFELTDEIAERIRSLGSPAPVNLAKLLPLATLKEEGEVISSGHEIIAIVIKDFETLIKEIKAIHPQIEDNDFVTTNLLDDILGYVEKSLWMLKSSI